MSDNNSTPLSAKPALLGLTLDDLTAVIGPAKARIIYTAFHPEN